MDAPILSLETVVPLPWGGEHWRGQDPLQARQKDRKICSGRFQLMQQQERNLRKSLKKTQQGVVQTTTGSLQPWMLPGELDQGRDRPEQGQEMCQWSSPCCTEMLSVHGQSQVLVKVPINVWGKEMERLSFRSAEDIKLGGTTRKQK